MKIWEWIIEKHQRCDMMVTLGEHSVTRGVLRKLPFPSATRYKNRTKYNAEELEKIKLSKNSNE